MYAPLMKIAIKSIYGGNLNDAMSICTPDMKLAILNISQSMGNKSNDFRLTDLYRSYEMQEKAHEDYISKKKTAKSPAPGGSMHEAGRAFDFELKDLKNITLTEFWSIAKQNGIVPIIHSPDIHADEAWHFECRGSHQLVYNYYLSGFGSNFPANSINESAYRAMAASAIVSTGCKVDLLGQDPINGYIQSGLIRLGINIGNLDGYIGNKTLLGLESLNIDTTNSLMEISNIISKLLTNAFPSEYT